MNNKNASIFASLSKSTSICPKISDLVLGYRSAKILFTAVELNLFEYLRKAPKSLKQITKHLSIDPRVGKFILNALVSLNFLNKISKGYINNSVSNQFLLKGSPDSFYHTLRYQNALYSSWSELTAIVKTGKPQKPLGEWLSNGMFTEDYILTMLEIAKQPAKEIVSALSNHKTEKMLDVGAGPGMYSAGFLKKYPKLEVTLLDLPSTLIYTKKIHSQKNYANRIRYIESSYHDADFPENQYDLVLLSHVLHNEGEIENKELLKKAFKSLRSNGKIAIHDFCLDKTECNPIFGALYSVHMSTYTEKGAAYRKDQFIKWLKDTGCTRIETYDICRKTFNASNLMVGTKL